HRYRIRPGRDARHVVRLARADSQSFALSDREERNPLMLAKDLPMGIEDGAGLSRFGQQPAQECGGVVAGNEASFLTIQVRGDGELQVRGEGTSLGLCHLSER